MHCHVAICAWVWAHKYFGFEPTNPQGLYSTLHIPTYSSQLQEAPKGTIERGNKCNCPLSHFSLYPALPQFFFLHVTVFSLETLCHQQRVLNRPGPRHPGPPHAILSWCLWSWNWALYSCVRQCHICSMCCVVVVTQGMCARKILFFTHASLMNAGVRVWTRGTMAFLLPIGSRATQVWMWVWHLLESSPFTAFLSRSHHLRMEILVSQWKCPDWNIQRIVYHEILLRHSQSPINES